MEENRKESDGGEMKIQKFEITIAVPQDIERINIEKIVEFLRGDIEELGFLRC